jgi:hypothetical protein
MILLLNSQVDWCVYPAPKKYTSAGQMVMSSAAFRRYNIPIELIRGVLCSAEIAQNFLVGTISVVADDQQLQLVDQAVVVVATADAASLWR